MSIHVHATYRDGLIYPDRPLELPENSEVDLTVTPLNGRREPLEPRRPTAPRLSAAEFADRLARHAVSVGALPADFSRADIYQDHD
jgi:hypothetical protein